MEKPKDNSRTKYRHPIEDLENTKSQPSCKRVYYPVLVGYIIVAMNPALSTSRKIRSAAFLEELTWIWGTKQPASGPYRSSPSIDRISS